MAGGATISVDPATPTGRADDVRARLHVEITGAVQGVGFRPYVYRQARRLGLGGWVANTTAGVAVEVEGPRRGVDAFVEGLDAGAPPHADIHHLALAWVSPRGEASFSIRESRMQGAARAAVLPDLATCEACRREVLDPGDRRFRYPFANCTACGPRYSIIETLPYDRARTTMRAFTMCPACRAEYEDPEDRRFHAQPNACPRCGPRLALWDAGGRILASDDAALTEAVHAIRAGAVVAVKGLGGFHLLVAAGDAAAVVRLRRRKQRPDKPLALMFADLAQVAARCQLSPLEAELLCSPRAPIVLLRRRQPAAGGAHALAKVVAPGNPYLGVMLPYTPLHHLLMHELGAPVVATSGNRSDEPIAFDEHEACARLGGIADRFLVHDRPILRPVEDSIVRVVAGRALVLRRARGYTPARVPLPMSVGAPVLASGGHLKNTVCLAVGGEAFLSPHVGDLGSAEAEDALARAMHDLVELYGQRPAVAACDLHPDYVSTHHARRLGRPLVPVQHHLAHVLSCLADNGLEGPALGVAWDGTGYGADGTVWGGEFLQVSARGFRRVAHLRPFRLAGGEAAVREPRRAALGLLYEIFGPRGLVLDHLPPVRAFTGGERRVLERVLAHGVNAPWTSSAGRLFDAVAALLDVRQRTSYEGQAAAELEWVLPPVGIEECFPLPLRAGGRTGRGAPWLLDWEPMVRALVGRTFSAAEASARFHNALAEAIVAVARRVGEPRVVLTGGCFQNAYLTERAVARLGAAGFEPYWHRSVPPNDGGIALGQAVWAGRRAAAARAGDVSCA